MDRRRFVAGAGAVLLAAPLVADAQQAGKVARIGVLGDTSPPPESGSVIAAFRQGLRDLGYVEGRNVTIEYLWADGNRERLPDLATDLVRSRVDVVLALGPASARAAKNATTTIPVVFVGSGDPIAEGLVSSLARPGGNITGLSNESEEMNAKWLELLKETVPALARVAVLWAPNNSAHRRMRQGIESAAQTLRVTAQFLGVEGRDDLTRAFTALTRARAGALIVLPGARIGDERLIVDLAVKNRLPGMYPFPVYAKEGGLMAYGPNTEEMSRQAATYVDKILKGAKPGDLPVEQPTKFELVINLKTAKALGITIPQSLLLRADQIIE